MGENIKKQLNQLNIDSILSALIFLILISWIAISNLHTKEISSLSSELKKALELKTKYDSLKSKWDTKVQKSSLDRLIKHINTLATDVKITKRKNYTKLTFFVETKNINILISKILNANLIYKSVKIEKNDQYSANISLEVVI